MFISLLQYEQLTIHHHPVEKKLEVGASRISIQLMVSGQVRHVILSMQLQPGRVLYAVKNDPPVEYSISFITNTL